MATRSLYILRQAFQFFYGAVHFLGLVCVFFPLFVALFGYVLPFPFVTALSISCILSLIIGAFLFRKLFLNSLRSDLFGLAAALLFTYFYFFKVCALIYDAVFPTGLVGMITQLIKGRYPASFIAFPEVPANYHQGYVTLTAAFQMITGIPVPAAMQVMILCGVFCFAIWSAEILRSTKSGLLLFLGGLFLIASFPRWPEWFSENTQLNFTEYVTMGDMFLSTSFAWGMPAFVLFFIVLRSKEMSHLRVWFVSAILIALSLFHATLYSIAWIVFFITEMLLALERHKTGNWRLLRSVPTALALAVAWAAPQFLPTALLLGPAYEKVDVSMRGFTWENLTQLLEYLRLSGAVLLVGAFILLSRKTWKLHRTIAIAALVCFFFPILFELKNVNIWDNLHKFAVVNQFFCLLLFALAWKYERSIRWPAVSFLIISIGTSTFSLRDAFTYRVNKNPAIYFSQGPSEPLVAFLRARHEDTMLFGYKHNLYTHDILSESVNHGGAFLRTSYYDNFLLSKALEDDFHAVEDWALEPQRFSDVIGKRLRAPNTFVAVETADLAEFKKAIEGFGEVKLRYQEFGSWILVSYP